MTTPDVRTLLRKALLRIEVLEQTAASREAERSEPIAIIGLACRFPGGGSNPEAFWQTLENGVDAVRRTPEERWAHSTMSGRDLDIQWAALLEDIRGFDAAFFGISPREALHLDPQQRLVLEVAWETLECAGQDVNRLNGSKTGVFLGQSTMDYAFLLNENQTVGMYSSTGTTLSTSAGRVAFTFGFQGPCLVLDTACSSSLVAAHLACQSLRQKECDLALAGGVNLILHPFNTSIGISMKALAPDGRCKTFDSRANGFVRGEGCGMVALKRLSDAERDGDPIFAVIRGSATNHDGRSTGLTVPSMLAQRAMLRAALDNAHVHPEEIGYVETHGTGTSLGDPIEFEALRQVLGQPRANGSTCVLGAVKTNIGHLEAAAGVAGLMKVIGALRKGRIPKNLHFETLNPHISIAGTPFVLPNESVPWVAKDKPRRAGISSFGFSGTNAHMILEEAPTTTAVLPARNANMVLMTVSAKSPEARNALAQSYAEHISVENGASLADITYTANARRTHHEYRLAVVGSSKEAISSSLKAVAAGETPAATCVGSARIAPKVIFVFSGQGSQWVGMGQQLMNEEPAFRAALAACDERLKVHAGFSILDELAKPADTSRLNDTVVAQPALFAIEVALAHLFQSWGIAPDSVIGHSVGEVAAAHIAGILDLDQAARLVTIRARIMQKATGHGKMVSVALDEKSVQDVLRAFEQRIGIAAVNDLESVVLSGDTEAMDRIVEGLVARGVAHRPLRVNYAFHSPQMDALRSEFVAALGVLNPSAGSIPMISTVTGMVASGENLDKAYWGDNIRQTVRFADAIISASQESPCTIVEMSPHAVLTPPIAQILAAKNLESSVVPTLRRDTDERKQALLALGTLHVRGHSIHWPAMFPNGGRVVALPAYPWQRKPFWFEPRVVSTPTVAGLVYDGFNSFISVDGATDSDEHWEMYLTFGPFRDVVSGFSWLDAALGRDFPPEYWQMSLDAQREMRRVLFRHVDFAACRRVLDFGCGYATDLMVLAKRHPHLQFDGYTISTEQAAIDVRRVAKAGLDQRIHIHHRDSAKDEFPAQYDLVFGFEVAHHIRDKGALFGNVSRHLVEGGALVLADFISNTAFEIEHEESSSFFLTKQQWVDVLSPHGLEIVDCIDISQEVANFLHDPDFDAKLAQASSEVSNRYSRSALVSYDRLGKTLRRGWTSYILLSVRKNVNLSSEELRQRNQAALAQLIPYEVANPGPARNPLEKWLFDVQWRRKELTNAKSFTEAIGTWLVVGAPRETTSTALVERLGQLENGCIRILSEGSYRQIAAKLFAFDLSSADDWGRFFAEHFRDDQRIAGIVDFSSCDTTPTNKTTAPTLTQDLERACVSTTALVQALVRHGFRQTPRLFLVTRGVQSVHPEDTISVAGAPILGLGKTIALEHPELRCTRIDLAPSANESVVEALLGELTSPTHEDQIALRDGARYVARLTRTRLVQGDHREANRVLEPARGRPYRLEMARPGVLTRLMHHEMAVPQPASGEVVIAVEAAGLTFLDVLAAVDAASEKANRPEGQTLRFGHECAGKIVAIGANVNDFIPGDEVIAMGTGAIGSFFTGRSSLVWKKPASLSWEQAATLPVSFLTAYYALEYLGRLRTGERVLIHAGTGGVGLAAIQWAQHVGAEIFATAGSEEKRQYLRSLGVRHVFDSRSAEFVEGIKQVTQGEGVDVVLNSLSGPLMTASLSRLADQGRFVEIGQRDSLENQNLELQPFSRNLSFSRLDLLGLSGKRPEFIGRLIREVTAFFEQGVFRPLPVQPFALAQAKDAFEFMAGAKHIGKIALCVTNEPEPHIVPLGPVSAEVVRPDATYLITGGLGGLGLSVAMWLVEQGARHVVLVGRRAPAPEAQTAIEEMARTGATIRVVSADISQENDVQRILALIRNEMPALAGIIHGAAVLDDHTLLEQTASSFHAAFAPKALGAWHLHVHTQRENLDFFVMYSSAASLLGSPGQANYCAANAFLDALARERVRLGLPAMSIQWGAFADVGLAAARDSRSARIASRGMTALTPTEGLEVLHQLLKYPRPEVGILRLDIRQWIEFYPAATRLPFLSELTAAELPPEKETTLVRETLHRLHSASPDERSWLLDQHLAEQIGFVLQLDPSRMDRLVPLQSLGLDSLTSLELRNRLELSVGVKLPATVTFTYPTIEALARHLLDMLGLACAAPSAPPEGPTETAHLAELAHLSDDELLRAGNEILGG